MPRIQPQDKRRSTLCNFECGKTLSPSFMRTRSSSTIRRQATHNHRLLVQERSKTGDQKRMNTVFRFNQRRRVNRLIRLEWTQFC
jgi:hypothetical protein